MRAIMTVSPPANVTNRTALWDHWLRPVAVLCFQKIWSNSSILPRLFPGLKGLSIRECRWRIELESFWSYSDIWFWVNQAQWYSFWNQLESVNADPFFQRSRLQNIFFSDKIYTCTFLYICIDKSVWLNIKQTFTPFYCVSTVQVSHRHLNTLGSTRVA